MIKLLKYFRTKDWIFCALVAGLIAGQVWLDLKTPDYMNRITQLLITGSATTSEVLKSGGLMLACTVGSVLFSVVAGFFVARLAAFFSAKLRSEVFNKVQDFSLSNLKKFSTPSLITRTTNDVNQIQMVVAMGLQVLIKAPITVIWAVCKITSKSWQWSLTTAIAVVVLIITIIFVVIFAVPKFKKIQKLTDGLNRVTRENLTGVRVVRAFNAEKFEENKLDGVNKDLTNSYLFVGKFMSVLSPIMTLVMSSLSLSIYWIGSAIINNTSMLQKQAVFSDMVVFMNYAVQIVMAFIMMAMIFIIMPRAIVSAKRINEVLLTNNEIKNGSFAGKTQNCGEIEFRNVSFKYPDADEYVLKNVSFSVKKGETVAFIGSTGSGKSTLINLVPRFYDCTEGEIFIDGVMVSDYDENTLRNKIGYVSQRAVIFAGSVKDNIAFGGGKTTTIEQVENSAKTAQASDFIESLEGKFDANLAQSGTNISGGQKQRVSIARALAWDPEIIIFDDSFSALDFKTDKKLRASLEDKKDVTKLIVAQRIGTIANADKIVVLSDGEVVGMGKHKELLDSCDVYKEIALSQLSKEEL